MFVNGSAMFVEAVFQSTFGFSSVVLVAVVSFYQNPNILCNNHNTTVSTVMQLIPVELVKSNRDFGYPLNLMVLITKMKLSTFL